MKKSPFQLRILIHALCIFPSQPSFAEDLKNNRNNNKGHFYRAYLQVMQNIDFCWHHWTIGQENHLQIPD